MQDFTITGVLGTDKTLILSQSIALSQGEHLTAKLKIEIPTEYCNEKFMLQFMCPNDFCYSTPLLAVVTEAEKHFVVYPLEGYVLRYAGTVRVQLEVRSVSDNAVLWKSVMGQDSVIQVVPSADMRSQTYARQDFFANAYATIDAMKQNEQDLNALEQDIDAVSKRCDDFLQAYEQKLSSGQLTGPQGATITSMIETGKDVEGNSIYTVSMSDGQQFQFVVKAGIQGEKGDKGDKGDTGLTGEYITDVTLYETLTNGDNKYKITTNLGNFYYFVAPKGTAGETLTALNLTSTDEQGNHTYTFVTNAGSNFNFVVPKGDKGDQGEKGEQGEKGDKGDTPSMDGTYQGLTAGKALADGDGNNIKSTYAEKSTIYRPNILINGDFKINQRTLTSYTGYAKYTVDRWFINTNNTTVSVVDNGVRIQNTTANAEDYLLVQRLIDNLSGKSMSLSVSVDGVIYKSENISAENSALYIDNKSLKVRLYKGTTYYTVAIVSTATCAMDAVVNWVKLEEGAYCTPYLTSDITTEMIKCQRYFVRQRAAWRACNYGGGYQRGQVIFPVKMYRIPTLNIVEGTSVDVTEYFTDSGFMFGVNSNTTACTLREYEADAEL